MAWDLFAHSTVIEDSEALNNIDEILLVKGVDIVGLARGDFSLSIGHPSQLNHPIVEDAVTKVIDHAKKAGVVPMVQFWAIGSKTKQYIDAGARVISLGKDLVVQRKISTYSAKSAPRQSIKRSNYLSRQI